METRSSLPHLQDPAICLNREPHQSSPHFEEMFCY